MSAIRELTPNPWLIFLVGCGCGFLVRQLMLWHAQAVAEERAYWGSIIDDIIRADQFKQASHPPAKGKAAE